MKQVSDVLNEKGVEDLSAEPGGHPLGAEVEAIIANEGGHGLDEHDADHDQR